MKSMRKIIADAIHYFTRKGFGSKKWKMQFAYFGENANIAYPSILSGIKDISIGDRTSIKAYSRMENYYSLNTDIQIFIGGGSDIGYYFTILNASSVIIGEDCLIASHVLITSENHTLNPELNVSSQNQPLRAEPVIIGNGCWIGEKVCILPGVIIGKKCIIGAGSVVTKSIPDYSIAVGNPAKVIKQYNFERHCWINVSNYDERCS